jgi:hypothetical protein
MAKDGPKMERWNDGTMDERGGREEEEEEEEEGEQRPRALLLFALCSALSADGLLMEGAHPCRMYQ